jgi:toluene monooxygenase system protein A
MTRLPRTEWLDLTRQLEWELSYVDAREAYPESISGPWLADAAWQGWDEPYKTSYFDYVRTQHDNEVALRAVREAVGRVDDARRLDRGWLSAVKLHAATLPLAEFAAVIGNLRAARFGRTSAWRSSACFGALDELRHTQIPLLLMHELVGWDAQFGWTHRLFHSNDWVAIAARHLVDELLLTADPIELAVGTNFVFETGFTNLQFVGLASMAHASGDRMFEKMLQSIQTDEARHAQMGFPVLEVLIAHDRAHAQQLVDKWFWRSWQLFAIVTGFAMDYLTPLQHRTGSFKEFVQEWILEHFERSLLQLGLARPWYWAQFLESIDNYHHSVYAAAYSYRATVWFDMVLPGPEERRWLAAKYPQSWAAYDPVWKQLTGRWRASGPGVEWYSHGNTPIGFCHLCQLVLCGGTPGNNAARVRAEDGKSRIFCSAPCEWIFEQQRERYAPHEGLVDRILDGSAPGNVVQLLNDYFGLSPEVQGKDAFGGRYPWLKAEGDG